jgi:hypothetical protein
VRRLATQSIFKPVSDPLRTTTHANLERVRQQFASSLPKITISADEGNQKRLKIADEMGDLLRTSGFEVRVRYPNIYTQTREPIKVGFHPKHRQFVEAVLMAFEPMLRATVALKEVPDGNGESITISIFGESTFTPEGIKVFE